MGNYLGITKKSKLLDSRYQDNQRLLLFDNMDEKIEEVEKNLTSKYTNMVMTYNKEINNLRIEINKLNKENENIVKKVNNLHIIINDRENRIENLQQKLYSMESNDEFLSTLDSDPEIDNQ